MRRLFAQKEPLACSSLGYTEVAAAISRQQGVQQISADRLWILRRDVLADSTEMLQAPLDASTLEAATNCAWELRARGSDAWHLAAAQVLHESLGASSVSLTLARGPDTGRFEIVAKGGKPQKATASIS